MNPLDFVDMPIILSVVMMPMMGADMVHEIMKSEELIEFMESDEKFDVCIFEIFTADALLVRKMISKYYWNSLKYP
jgi:hypothetical protein